MPIRIPTSEGPEARTLSSIPGRGARVGSALFELGVWFTKKKPVIS
jgi:hypothetical protein